MAVCVIVLGLGAGDGWMAEIRPRSNNGIRCRFFGDRGRKGALGLLLLLAGCAAVPDACPVGASPATIAEAYFGRSVKGRAPVTDAEWARFMADTVTPAFPDGLTVLDGAGQWRNAAGQISREDSKVLVLVLPGQDQAAASARLAPVTAAWKARFAQESVLTAFRAGCAGF
jgi:hypothetical protein